MVYHEAAFHDVVVVVGSGRMVDVEVAKGAYDFRGTYGYDGSDCRDDGEDDGGKAVSASAAFSRRVVVHDGDVQRKAQILPLLQGPRVHV